MPILNVLVLHQMGDPRYIREAVRSLEYMVPECGVGVDCIVHDAAIPFPDYLREISFHLIVLGPTFLCNRYDCNRMNQIHREYEFIRHSQACKVALPQDDYDCSEVLDDWMVSWSVDRVYSVCPDKWDILYPKYNKTGNIRLGYTGYISDDWIQRWRNPKPYSQRTIDVSYRASKLPANFGSVGYLKSAIAGRFIAALPESKFNLDISIDRRDIIPGRQWHIFLEDSRFCLVTPSGSSLLDPRGKFKNCVQRYCANNPDVDFGEIEQICFSGEDRKYMFTAISPRNIEAALAETIQIATSGDYSGIMRPFEHFIPLDEDCSNIDSVIRMMEDHKLIDKIRADCKDAILSEPRLRSSEIVREILTFARNTVISRELLAYDAMKCALAFARYRDEAASCSRKFWARRRNIERCKNFCLKLDILGLRRAFRGVR